MTGRRPAKRRPSSFGNESSPRKRTRQSSPSAGSPAEETSSEVLVRQAQELERQQMNPLTERPYGFQYGRLLEVVDKLPVRQTGARIRIIEALKQSNVLVITSSTGSGKTTQIPKYLLYDQAPEIRKSNSRIACTQPRVVAAVESAKRVAEELDVVLGQQVGYKVGEKMKTSANTLIQYMTDGMLLAEIYGSSTNQQSLRQYGVIIIDEAHERNADSDVLLSILKQQLPAVPNLKLIIMSATLNARTFLDWFPGATEVKVEGSPYPVETQYTVQPVSDYHDAVEATIRYIVSENIPGDILVFVPGEEDVNTLRSRLDQLQQYREHHLNLDLYTLHGGLTQVEKDRVLNSSAKPGLRRTIMSTNIAETSLTVNGIRHVIDCGLSKLPVYDRQLKCQELRETTISKASAIQRKGRVGRTSSGTCWRLYTQEHYDSLPDETPPPITRVKLPRVILGLRKHVPDENIYARDFVSPPPPQLVHDALAELSSMGCLDEELKITDLGRKSLAMGCEVELAVMMLCAQDLGVQDEVTKLAAVLSLQRPSLIFAQASEEWWQRGSEASEMSGELQTYIHAMQLATHPNKPVVDDLRCKELGFNRWAVQQAHDKWIDFTRRLPVSREESCAADHNRDYWLRQIQTAVYRGYCMQVAKHYDGDMYQDVRTQQIVQLDNRSILYPANYKSRRPTEEAQFPKLVVYGRISKLISKTIISDVLIIDGRTINRAAADFEIWAKKAAAENASTASTGWLTQNPSGETEAGAASAWRSSDYMQFYTEQADKDPFAKFYL